MSTGRRILNNIFSLTAAELAGKGLQAFVIFYIANLLGDSEYGIYGFARTHVAFYILAAVLGTDVFGTREIAADKSRENIRKTVNNIFSIRIISASLAYGVLLIVAFSSKDMSCHARTMLLISGANIFSMSFMLHWVYQGVEKMGIFAVRNVIAASLNITGLLIFVHGPEDSTLAMIIVQTSMMLNAIWLFLYYRKDFGGISFSLDIEEWKRILKISVSIGLSFFVVMIYNSLDMTMMFYILGEGHPETGHLNLGHQYVILGILPAQIIQMSFFPQFSRNNTSEPGDKLMQTFFTVMLTLGLFTGGFIAIFPDELAFFFLDKYPDLGKLLLFFGGTVLFTFTSILFYTPLMAKGKEKLCVLGNLGALAVNFLLNLILIPRYGMYGAAIATIAGEIAVTLILGYVFWKFIGRLYLAKLHIWIIVSGLSLMPAFAIKNYFGAPIPAIIVSIILFVGFNFIFKVITPEKIRGVMKKSPTK